MKDVLHDLWKDKPLLITVLIGLAVVGYLLYKSNAANVVAPTIPGGKPKKHKHQHDHTGSPPIPTGQGASIVG